MRVVAVQYGFCHIMVTIDPIFTYLTLSTYLRFGSTSARVAQHLTFENFHLKHLHHIFIHFL